MIPSKLIVTLVSGKAGVGKTTLANFIREDLQQQGKSSIIIPFASSLKGIAHAMGWDGKKDDKGRSLLQGLGTIGREYNPDIWIDLSYKDVMEYAMEKGIYFYITDDWRFPNEFDRLSGKPLLQVFKVRVTAPAREILKGTPQYNDVSETSLPDGFTMEADEYYDLEVGNYGTLDELHISSTSVVQYILDNCRKWQV